jgi:hypothetical protein
MAESEARKAECTRKAGGVQRMKLPMGSREWREWDGT